MSLGLLYVDKKLIYDLSFKEIQDFVILSGFKRYCADQIWSFLYRRKVKSFFDMHNLPNQLIQLLEEKYHFKALEYVLHHKSADKTTKFLFSLKDKHLIEVVLMYQYYGISICVTTQVGCNIGCSFCASGQLSKKRNLTSGEIVCQILEAERISKQKVKHVVVMGIGEPFDNFDHLKKFLFVINNNKGISIGARHITVSTSGIVPKILAFSKLGIQVNLAISLHAADDTIRSKLMRINNVYGVEKLINAVREYVKVTNRRVTFEYIMIDGVNDSIESALSLVNLIKDIKSYVNLIPYNQVIEAPYKRSKIENMNKFYDILKKNKIQVTLRKEMGHDINAACGQLRSQHSKNINL